MPRESPRRRRRRDLALGNLRTSPLGHHTLRGGQELLRREDSGAMKVGKFREAGGLL
jgi:hypothetical protein